MQTILCPYLNFEGNAREAMTFYHSVLGGELTFQTCGEAFPDTPAEHKDRIMHAHLASESINVMASDTFPDQGTQFVAGNNVHLSLIGSDEDSLREYFNKLADGGTVGMPLQKQFWGDTFGMVTDKFGIHWMVNISAL